jgi:hypothetical protein
MAKAAMYNDLIIMDTTFGTNCFSMKLLFLVGVNGNMG